MNFDGKALRMVVLGDGSAFGATSRTLAAGAHDLIIENLSESVAFLPPTRNCFCIADYAGCAASA